MEYLIALAGIAVVTLLLTGMSGCSRPKEAGDPLPCVAAAVTEGKPLERSAVRTLLKRLAESPAPKPQHAAVCYGEGCPPFRTDYICPKCGERTLYGQSMAQVVERDLPTCRRECKELAEHISGAVDFDESQYCRRCSPGLKDPKAVLTLKYDDGKSHTIVAPTTEDLRILRELFQGELAHRQDDGATSLLKDKLPRLEKLLGMNRE